MAVTPYAFYPHSICFALPSLLLLYLLFHECEWLAIISEYEPRKWKTLRIFKKDLMRVQTLLLDIGFTYFEILNHLIEFWSPLAGNFISKLIQKCFRCFKHRLWNTYFSEHVFSLPSFLSFQSTFCISLHISHGTKMMCPCCHSVFGISYSIEQMYLRTHSFGIIKSTCFYVPLFRNSFDSQPPMKSVCVGTGGEGEGLPLFVLRYFFSILILTDSKGEPWGNK